MAESLEKIKVILGSLECKYPAYSVRDCFPLKRGIRSVYVVSRNIFAEHGFGFSFVACGMKEFTSEMLHREFAHRVGRQFLSFVFPVER